MAEERQPFYSYKEVRVRSDPPHPASTIAIRLPAHANAHQATHPASRRDPSNGSSHPEDETAFAKAHLATSAALYFRHNKKHPRSFLWRVLEEGMVLSIQSVDLSKSSTTAHDPFLTLRFTFPNPIRPAGVAFADSEKHTSLSVFVVTSANDLYTLTIPAQFFHQASAIEGSLDRWCKTFLPSSFSFRYPHRLVARSPEELLVSLHDGGLLRLTRPKDSDGSTWTETSFNEGGWGSHLRGLIPWQGNNTIRFGDANLEQTTATAIAFAPALSRANGAPEHVFTICLNHTLKAWNLSTGKIGFTRDLLNQARTPQDSGKYSIDPTRTSLMTIIDQRLRGERDHYYLITFSPVGSGAFKFWAVSDPDHEEDGLEDLYPDSVFEPPPPSSEIWSVAEFNIAPAGEPGQFTLWILWKNNIQHRLQSLHFDLLNLVEDWQKTWAATTPESLISEPLPVVSSLDCRDPTEKWLEYLLHPGRFDEAVLETALSIYQQNINVSSDSYSRKSKSLPERICLSVGATASLAPGDEGGMDFHRYRIDVDFQWRRYYRIVIELNKQRGEVLSLAHDDYAQMTWVVAASGLSAIRDCGIADVIWHNPLPMLADDEIFDACRPDLITPARSVDAVYRVAGLIKVASEFTEGFSDVLVNRCRVALDTDCFSETSRNIPGRAQRFYESCEMHKLVTDEDITQLKTAMTEHGVADQLDTDLFQAAIALFAHGRPPSTCETVMTAFGRDVVTRGTEETVYLSRTILLNLLIVVIFIAFDGSFEPEPENPYEVAHKPLTEEEFQEQQALPQLELTELRQQFDIPEVYTSLIGHLKELLVIEWLTSAQELSTSSPAATPGTASKKLLAAAAHDAIPEHPVSTLLRVPFARKWRPRWTQPRHSMSSLLTASIGDLIGSLQLQEPTVYRHQMLTAQFYYLSRGELDLASDVMRFQYSDSWSVYMKGRINLLQQEFVEAALHFRRASFQLAAREGLDLEFIQDSSSPALIDKHEANFFATGMHSYFYHIVKLFVAASAHSQVVEFARSCLQLVNTMPDDPSLPKLRTELHSHIFTASLSLSHFDAAYSALLHLNHNPSKQLSHLQALVLRMCSPQHHLSARLLSYPFLGLQSDLDDLLYAQTQTQTQTQTQKHLSPASSETGVDWSAILYSLRVQRGDFRGGAMVLFERLERLKADERLGNRRRGRGGNAGGSGEGEGEGRGGAGGTGGGEEEVERAYLALINALASVEPTQAWLLTAPPSSSVSTHATGKGKGTAAAVVAAKKSGNGNRAKGGAGLQENGHTENGARDEEMGNGVDRDRDGDGDAVRGNAKGEKRVIVTLEDIRREYQGELDRRERLEGGRFAFDAGEGDGSGEDDEGERMEVDVDVL